MFKKPKQINKSVPSGFVISLIFHAAAFFVAGLFVVFTVLPKEESEFKALPPVARPKMHLKKPKVKIKKSSQPKPSSRIVAKVKTAKMPEIQIPDLVGTGEGLLGGLGSGGDFMDMPDMSKVSSFGREYSTGNDFKGTLYQLSHNRSGGSASMGEDEFRVLLRKYVMQGWDDSIFARYYRFPRQLYATHFVIPPIPSPLAPDQFGAPDMECYYMFAVYKGKLVFHEDIKFRFWGIGDAFLFVNVDGKEVLVSGWADHRNEYFNWWQSSAPDDNTVMLCNMPMSVGDWIELKANEPVDMNVLFGEWKGGVMAAILLVEVEGVDYPKSHWNAPLLPAFKTDELAWDEITEASKYLPEEECSLTNGPVFRDFIRSGQGIVNGDADERQPAESSSAPESSLRQWKFNDGHVLEAEFKNMLFDKVVLKDVSGEEITVSPSQLSEKDQSHIRLCVPPELNIEFSRKSRQRFFPPTLFASDAPPEGIIYTFSAKIKQESSTRIPYGSPLTVEFFAIGDQIMAEKRVLLDHKVERFILSDENDFSFISSGKEVQLLDFNLNRARRGTRYGGYLVVIRDVRGKIIAHEESSKNLYENLDSLSRRKVGWYFDDECKRCLPKPPPPWNFRRIKL
jgi:hypothetical protein